MKSVRLALLPFALLAGAPASAQQPESGSAESRASDSASDPIVVDGVRLRDPEELPVSVAQPTEMNRVSRGLASEAAQFTRCAGLPRPELLHRILDGRPESGEADKALHWHMVRNIGCLQDVPSSPIPASPYFGLCNPDWVNPSKGGQGGLRTPLIGNLMVDRSVCRVHFDRGFIYEEALREYAPDLALSRSNTFDHATRDRFRAREEVRNSARSPASADFFFAAACMVQIRPKYALALLHEEPGSAAEGRLRAMMISDGAACVGNAAEVEVDARQFRAFVAEAVYAWAVAVRRADTLLPPQRHG